MNAASTTAPPPSAGHINGGRRFGLARGAVAAAGSGVLHGTARTTSSDGGGTARGSAAAWAAGSAAPHCEQKREPGRIGWPQAGHDSAVAAAAAPAATGSGLPHARQNFASSA
ncbi:hypothetical protein ASC76_16010 [Rhizobacter sp. Root404]|nr:hypothetical protein ASC76_16010 [Rhizobacter sp. Root404]